MITLEQYFGKFAEHPDVTATHRAAATILLVACNQLISFAKLAGVAFPLNPFTKSVISGSLYGGFRPLDCKIGAEKSSHKTAQAVDLYDPFEAIDAWCLANSSEGGRLAQCGIYLEHPTKTAKWSHWTTRRPGSGRRVFFP